MPSEKSMEIITDADGITINNPLTFNPKHILECGQVFRYYDHNNHYDLIAGDKMCRIYTNEDFVRIKTEHPLFFTDYFDLSTDYQSIINILNQDYGLAEITQFGHGIRILRQEPFETIISFIISANNNIKRIQGIIERLCDKLGEDRGGYHAFPSPYTMANAPLDFYIGIGAGYRAEYILKTAKMISDGFSLDIINQMPSDEAKKYLARLSGVGPKVADCILLFAYHRTDVFPVDTWIAKVYNEACGHCADRNMIGKYLLERYGNLSGYVQQYLFYYKRENRNLSIKAQIRPS